MINTKSKIQVLGRALLQTHGYNGFSFKDIGDRLGVRKESVFEHFKSKEDLILEILATYTSDFHAWAKRVDPMEPLAQIKKVFDIFYSFSSDKSKVCPVLALAVDTKILTPKVRKALEEFVNHWLDWLESKIAEGQQKGQVRNDLNSKALCSLVYSAGMGSQLQARILRKSELTLTTGESIVKLIAAKKRERSIEN